MTVKQRLIEFIEYTKLNVSAFQKYCELPNGYVNNMRRSVGPEAVKKIKSKYPDLNEIWLLHGQGNMLLNADDKIKVTPSSLEKIMGETSEDLIRIKASLMVLEQMVDLSVSQQTGKSIGIVSGERRRAVSMEQERLLSEFRKKYG